jgi:uroporphyrinogen-III synthase
MSPARARVLFTGAPGALAGLGDAVALEGAEFVDYPLLSFGPPASPAQLDDALRHLARYVALCITSPRAARVVAEWFGSAGAAPPAGTAVWTSPACEGVLAQVFSRVVTAGPGGDGAGLGARLADAMLRQGVGSPVLFACGDLHREELVTRLRDAGREVHVVEAYRTVLADAARADAAVRDGGILVVTSPAVARLLSDAPARPRPALVAIGPTTAAEATRCGWIPDAVAASPTSGAVASAIHSLLPSYS